jgi:hypothetical protein
MVEALIFAGADIIKVGIGPGSVCTTRLIFCFLPKMFVKALMLIDDIYGVKCAAIKQKFDFMSFVDESAFCSALEA